jgi:DNA-directed RNA polymerase subunit RPC12/RpoP
MSDSANTYTCAACGEEFENGWTDEEAEAEYQAAFTGDAEAGAPKDTVCDDCYHKIMLTCYIPDA